MLIVAVDIGGTFTDLLAYDTADRRLYSSKAATTPVALESGIRECLGKAGVRIDAIDGFVHGSTIAINTVLERKGARTALVVTKGTRDVYKIGRGNRPDAYDIRFKRPEPLAPRHLTFEVEERLLATGEVHTALNPVQAERVAQKVAESGVEAVAVCFLHSWNNPVHESQMAELLKASPEIYCSISHEILREYGEYERISTTVLNSYIGPKVSGYLEGLERMLDEEGFAGKVWIMQSNGGVMSSSVARRRPVAMLESGPVGGFIAAARTGAALGYPNIIGFDMGGTTAKASPAPGGEPQISHGYYIGGYASGQPMMLPVVDTVEVGSGGGSIARVDHTGSLKVGPVSAGADPGPACYGKGGTEPTVTDANVVLGRIDPRRFLGGEMPLEVDAAREAIERGVGGPLGLSVAEAAGAIIEIAVMNMSLAVRQVSTERGYDPRDFVMVAFGGAGPLHACEVARSLHIPVVVIPNFPGQFSASGMLMAEQRQDFVRTYYRRLEDADFGEIARIFGEMEELGRERMVGTQKTEDRRQKSEYRSRRFLEVRYGGQDFSLQVAVEGAGDRGAVEEAFHELHRRRFGYCKPGSALEIVNVRLTASAAPALRTLPAATRGSGPALVGRRAVVFQAGAVDCAVYWRESLAAGERIEGPAVIQEYASTTLLFPGDGAEVAGTGELVIRVGEQGRCRAVGQA